MKKHPQFPKVFFVIVNYNEYPLTQACLESLQTLSYPNYEIIVVDNGSSDGSAEAFRQAFPEVIVLETGENLGYTGGNNAGVRYALEHEANYINVMNPDTIVVNPDYITQLVDYMESRHEVGIVGPKVYWHEKGVIQNTVLFIPDIWKRAEAKFKARLNVHNISSGDEELEAEAINGVCLFVRAAFFADIGYFDEKLFIYVDEADIGYRARQRGWKLMYLPVESIIHLQKPTGYGMTGNASFLQKRNSVYLLKKRGKGVQAWIYASLSLSLMVLRTVIAPMQGRSFIEHYRFSRRLFRAYRKLLLFNQMVR
jgi:GT2 family glycosyltransferase